MNSVVRQLHEQNTDVVMVDTGNSYEGLCEYLNGKYISYTEEKPITMNPFRINRQELNVEKTGFLKNLVLLIWKGSQGTVSKTEDRLIDQVITEYYDVYFNGFDGFTPPQREDLRKSLLVDDRTNPNGKTCARACWWTTAPTPVTARKRKRNGWPVSKGRLTR